MTARPVLVGETHRGSKLHYVRSKSDLRRVFGDAPEGLVHSLCGRVKSQNGEGTFQYGGQQYRSTYAMAASPRLATCKRCVAIARQYPERVATSTDEPSWPWPEPRPFSTQGSAGAWLRELVATGEAQRIRQAAGLSPEELSRHLAAPVTEWETSRSPIRGGKHEWRWAWWLWEQRSSSLIEST